MLISLRIKSFKYTVNRQNGSELREKEGQWMYRMEPKDARRRAQEIIISSRTFSVRLLK